MQAIPRSLPLRKALKLSAQRWASMLCKGPRGKRKGSLQRSAATAQIPAASGKGKSKRRVAKHSTPELV